MGINYSSSVGYGIAVTDTDAATALTALEPYEDGPIPELLEEKGWDLIDYDFGGNWVSGPHAYFFYVKGTESLYAEIEFTEPIVEFSDSPAVSLDALRQLNQIADYFDIPGSIGWKLIPNVT